MSTFGRRPARCSHVKHADVVAAAKASPEQWVAGSFHASDYVARNVARRIRLGTFTEVRAYQPEDAYDAEVRFNDEGAQVWIKYVGPRAEADAQ